MSRALGLVAIVLALTGASVADGGGGCATPGRVGTPGLISRGWYMCNTNYPRGVAGPQRTLIETNFAYNVGSDAASKQRQASDLLATAFSRLEQSNPAGVQFTFPGQRPYDLWIALTIYAKRADRPSDLDCAAEAGALMEDPRCDLKDDYWAGVTVSGMNRGWFFNHYTRHFDAADENQRRQLLNEVATTIYGRLANGWTCNADGTTN